MRKDNKREKSQGQYFSVDPGPDLSRDHSGEKLTAEEGQKKPPWVRKE